MKLIFTERGWEDYLWFQANERKLLKKINTLIKDIQREPFEGLGKPEPLKSNLSGYWSRRIDAEHLLADPIFRLIVFDEEKEVITQWIPH